MSGDQCVVPLTLDEAHDVVWRRRPAKDASPMELAAFHRRSAKVYVQTAESDERHRHEALQCAGFEIRKAACDIEDRLSSQGNES